MTILIFKTTPPFSHEWQRVRVSSRHRICTGRANVSIIIILRSSSTITIILILNLKSLWSRWRIGGGEVSETKPPMTACRRAIRLTQMFTWYSSVESVSRWASMRWSCTMMSLRVTSPTEDEGVDVDRADRDGAERVGGGADSDCLYLNCASLRLTVAASMAHM